MKNLANFLLSLLDKVEPYQMEYDSRYAGKTIYRNFDLTDQQKIKKYPPCAY